MRAFLSAIGLGHVGTGQSGFATWMNKGVIIHLIFTSKKGVTKKRFLKANSLSEHLKGFDFYRSFSIHHILYNLKSQKGHLHFQLHSFNLTYQIPKGFWSGFLSQPSGCMGCRHSSSHREGRGLRDAGRASVPPLKSREFWLSSLRRVVSVKRDHR